MNSRLICIAPKVLSRRWLVVTDIVSRCTYSTIYQHGEQGTPYRFHKSMDFSYSQYKSFHQSNYLSKRRKTREERKMPKDFTPPPSKHKQKQVVEIWKDMTVKELADSMDMTIDNLLEVMDYVPNTDKYFKGSSVIDDLNTLQLVVKRLGRRWVLVTKDVQEEREINRDVIKQPPPDPRVLVKRHPVVTIMGHVDHGKTTLLDTLRNTSVVEKEFGGITQHIGAFSVKLKENREITFLDTPGHAAFTSMRSRGASVTDIVVLVVAADDGVMEQTDESLRMAREAKVPIIIAINKIDKPQADIERTKRMLLEREVLLEDVGGDVQFIPISALKGTNIDALIEAILVQAEIMELKGDPTSLCEGVIIESKQDQYRGKLATIIVQRGTLTKNKVLVAGLGWAKVRKMLDDKQKEVISAEPSTPVEIMGWRELPSAGDIVLEVESEKRAHEVIDWREKQKLLTKAEQDKVFIDMKAEEHDKQYKQKLELRRKMGRFKLKPTGPREKEVKEDTDPKLCIIIKGDVDGSVEAIIDILATYNSRLCKLDVVHFEVGNVTLSDIELAGLFNAVIYAFNVNAMSDAKEAAREKDLQIRYHNVIYKLIDDLKEDINKQLPLVDKEDILGEATVLQQFTVTDNRKKVQVAGCRCISGSLKRNSLYKVIRKNAVIHSGLLQSMRHLKDEVDTIKQDMECGLRLADTSIAFEPGDKLVCYEIRKEEQFTDWNPGF